MWVIFTEEGHRLYRNPRTRRDAWATAGAAKAEMTREKLDIFKYGLASKEYFHARLERTKIVKSLMTGEDVEIPENTPLCCDPSSETYWSM